MFLPATLFRPMSRWVSPFYENDGGLVGVKFGMLFKHFLLQTVFVRLYHLPWSDFLRKREVTPKFPLPETSIFHTYFGP